MKTKIIYSIFIIVLGLLAFFNVLYIPSVNLQFISLCLILPIIIFSLDKIKEIKIGSMFELKTKLDNIEKQQEQLIKQIMNISNNNSNVTNIYSSIEPATKEDIENKNKEEEEEEEETEKNQQTTEISKQINEYQDFGQSINETIPDLATKKIPNVDFINTSKLVLQDFLRSKSNAIIESQPLSINYSLGSHSFARKVIFDGYFKEYNAEFFVEVKSSRGYNSIQGVKRMLEAIKIYNKTNTKNTCLILILFDFKPLKRKINKEDIISKMMINFSEEIASGLLFIEYYDFEKIQKIKKEKELINIDES